ncbi:MAG: glycosyltransferase [Rhodobiaceae bacterium]|nr:glycosyltransferase [Rhodobiaceae bacterium]MCC0018649.1 glycosyltransferase [Rhodobiaceae bacterium]MCC0050997.1 glycosyltransferase [Rhodobiaceae bacterium]MCC0060356.1 glycosyltransferase [Rhodobiaceae bacterium]
MTLIFAEIALAGFLFVHLATAALTILRLRRPAVSPGQSALSEPVGVIVPVAGLDAREAKIATTALRLVNPDVEIVFCAFDESEPAVAVVRAALEQHPDANARLLIGREHTTRNPKLDNIEKGYAAISADLAVSVDGNIDVPADLIGRLMSVHDARTGVSSAVPIGTQPETFAADVECAALNTFYARWQFCADELGDGKANGKVFMVRRSLLERAGGVDKLGSDTAEDASATKIANGFGLKTRLITSPVAWPIGARSLAEVWSRYLRWAQLRKQSYPALYVLESLITPAPAMVLAAGIAYAHDLSPFSVMMLLLVIWYGVEAALAHAVGWPWTWRFFPACLVRDAMMVTIWPIAMVKRTYLWRGRIIDTSPDTD